MVGAQAELDVTGRIAAVRPLADDAHFGVREWAWMAVRPHLAQELDTSIAHLARWTAESSERLRRFASEALRPRGVWCAHIAALKREPEQALPILLPLRADPSVYVQDSVANWLNDAAKDQSDWVRGPCAKWMESTPADTTRRICQRALRRVCSRCPYSPQLSMLILSWSATRFNKGGNGGSSTPRTAPGKRR